MSSRERVLRAVRHEPVDRMPIDLGCYTATSISAFAYRELRSYLGLEPLPIEITGMVQFTPRIHRDVLERFHCDCVQLKPAWKATRSWTPRGDYRFEVPAAVALEQDATGQWNASFREGRMRMPPGGFFFDGDWLECEERDGDELLRVTAREAERIYNETDYFTIYRGFDPYFVHDNMDWLCRMLTEPDEIRAELERDLAAELERADTVIRLMGRYIQCVSMSADMGTQRGPLVNPEVYADVCAPFLRRFCAHVHDSSDLKIFMHNCGGIRPLIPILIDCGVDILNPVQVSAQGMEPRELKRLYGDRITFWGGGCDTQNVLARGTPEEVRANVRELVGIFKPGSGYVFNQVHNIMGDVQPASVVAMLDTAYEEAW